MTDEDAQKLIEAAMKAGRRYAQGAGDFLSEHMKEEPGAEFGLPPAAVVAFGSIVAGGIITTTLHLIKDRAGHEAAKKALVTSMEVLSSMLTKPEIGMDVSIQVLVKERPGEETSRRR